MRIISRSVNGTNKTVVTINGKTSTYNGNVSIVNGKIISGDESIDISEFTDEKQITINITGNVSEISGVSSVNVDGNVEGNITDVNKVKVAGNAEKKSLLIIV